MKEIITLESLPLGMQEARLAEKLTANARELYLQLPEMGSKEGMIKKNGVSIAPVIRYKYPTSPSLQP